MNGRKLYSKYTRHISIRYFYIKDLIDKNLITIQYYTTKKILANFFVKLLQSKLSKYLHSFLIANYPISELIILLMLKKYVKIPSSKDEK